MSNDQRALSGISSKAGSYPQFPLEEYQRRHDAARSLCSELGIDALLVFGWSALGRALQADVHYLSGYLGTRDNYVVLPVDSAPVLIAQSRNHIPNAASVSVVDDVRWGGPSSATGIVAVLKEKGLRRVGIVGWMPYQHRDQVAAALPGVQLTDVTGPFRLLRVTKSALELDWLTRGARFTDAALMSLAQNTHVGMREYELADVIERAYTRDGGMASFYYLSSTSMSKPDKCVPAQVLSGRTLEAGDLITTEISIAYDGYAGQGLRTYTVGADPTPQVQEMHAIAVEVIDEVSHVVRPGATPEDVWRAADRISAAGYSICDALLHGFGMGILPPTLMTRQTTENPDNVRWTFEENQTIVIQPNVVTPDQSLGIQVGDLCVVTPTGARSLHSVPREIMRCD